MPSQSLIEVQNLVKQYQNFVAVDHLSFQVYGGEIFGLLGPNGAGKTTTIRMLIDILKPDEGEISVLGQAPAQVREQVGYLPEERGLYPKQKVLDVLIYLAELKGMARSVAKERAITWLARVELSDWANHKVRDLSRGMQQKLQFIASFIHDPQLIILDEPFQNLDPVNVALVKEQILALQAAGKTIVLSAHQMNLVEALCDRILLINHGRSVLYGLLSEIKTEYAPNLVRLRTPDTIGQLPGVSKIERKDRIFTLTLDDIGPQDLLRILVNQRIEVELFEVASAPLEEIFIAAVREEAHA